MNEPRELPAPPTGEEIHLPAPSLVPLATAVGVTILVVGLALSVAVVVVGGVITLLAVTRWIRDVHREIEELPPHHH